MLPNKNRHTTTISSSISPKERIPLAFEFGVGNWAVQFGLLEQKGVQREEDEGRIDQVELGQHAVHVGTSHSYTRQAARGEEPRADGLRAASTSFHGPVHLHHSPILSQDKKQKMTVEFSDLGVVLGDFLQDYRADFGSLAVKTIGGLGLLVPFRICLNSTGKSSEIFDLDD
jgi:hypothetical protein